MQATARLHSFVTDSRYDGAERIIIDAGVERVHVHCDDRTGKLLKDEFHTSSSVRDGFAWHEIPGGPEHQAYRLSDLGPPPNDSGPHPTPKQANGSMFQLLVGSEGSGYNIGIPEWSLVRAFQGVVLQGVLHDLMFKGGTSCRDFDEYQEFTREYWQFKRELYGILETTPGRGLISTKLLNAFENLDSLAMFIKYSAYGLHDRGLHRTLRTFSDKWINTRSAHEEAMIRVYIDGEACIRVSQAEDIFLHLLASLGFRRFTLDCSPVWTYLVHLLDEDAMVNREKLHATEDQLHADAGDDRQELRQLAIQHKKSLARAGRLRILFRQILARPRYKAAGLTMPAAIPSVLQVAKEMVPTLVPYGELAPYVGEVLTRLREGYDLCLNVAPDGCMVSSMSATLTPINLDAAAAEGRIENLFSADSEVDEELLAQAVLKALGPQNDYRSAARKSVVA